MSHEVNALATLVVAALAAAAPVVGKKLCEQSVTDAYQHVKKRLNEIFGPKSKVAQAVADLEAEPEREGRRIFLKEELEAEGLRENPALLEAAKTLLQLVKNEAGGGDQIAMGSHNAIARDGSSATVTHHEVPKSPEG